MNNKEIANLPIYTLQKETTIGEYLKHILRHIWNDGALEEGFDGSWKYDVYITLVENDIVNGKLDKHGFLDDIDEEKANNLISLLIKSIAFPEE